MSRASLITAGALAALLAGCGTIGGPKTEVKVYSPATEVTVDAGWPRVDWSLSVGVQAANAMLDSPRIVVRPSANVVQTYKGARWADNAPDLLQTALVQAFEDSGRMPSVMRAGGGSTPRDWQAASSEMSASDRVLFMFASSAPDRPRGGCNHVLRQR